MNKYYDKSRKAYNKKAINYDKTVIGRFTLSMKLFLLKHIELKKEACVLDVACGNGWFLSQLVERERSIKAHGIDIAPKMIEMGKKNYPNINFKVGSSAKLNYKDNYFDLITVNAAFHHFPEAEKFIIEVKRCLKNNGKIYINEIYVLPILRHVLNFFMPIAKNGDYKWYSPKDITKLYLKCGLKNIHVFKHGYTEIVVAQKQDIN